MGAGASQRGLGLAAVLAVCLALGGCFSDLPHCAGRGTPACGDPEDPCALPPDQCGTIPPGASGVVASIESSPTAAAIYVNGAYVGKTPLKRYLWFTSTTRTITVAAEPLYPGQARQERQLRVPQLPVRLRFFMNTPPNPEAGD